MVEKGTTKKVKTKKLIQFCDIVPNNVNGDPDPIPGLNKGIADLLYRHTQSCDMLEVAMKINQGKAVDLTIAQAAEIMSIVNDPKVGVKARIRTAVTQFLEEHIPK